MPSATPHQRFITPSGGKPHAPNSMTLVSKPRNPYIVVTPPPQPFSWQSIMRSQGLTLPASGRQIPLRPCVALAGNPLDHPHMSSSSAPSLRKQERSPKSPPLHTPLPCATSCLLASSPHASFPSSRLHTLLHDHPSSTQ